MNQYQHLNQYVASNNQPNVQQHKQPNVFAEEFQSNTARVNHEPFVAPQERSGSKQNKKNRSLSQLRNFRPAVQVNQNQKGSSRQRQDENMKPGNMSNNNSFVIHKENNNNNNTYHDDQLLLKGNAPNQQQQQIGEEVFSSNLSHRLKSQGKLIGLQRMRSQQNSKQQITSNQHNSFHENSTQFGNQSQIHGQGHALNNNVALINQIQNGLMSQRLSNSQRNYYAQQQQQHGNFTSSHQLQQQQLYQQLQIGNNANNSYGNANNNSNNNSEENTNEVPVNQHSQGNNQNIQSNHSNNFHMHHQGQMPNSSRQSSSNNRNIYNNEKSYQPLQKQNSHYSSNGRNSSSGHNNTNNNNGNNNNISSSNSHNNSGDLNQFRRSMNRLQQKPQSQQQQNNSSRVLQVNKLFQNDSFSVGDNQKKFFNNLGTAVNAQQIDALQFPKSARKVLGGPATVLNGFKNNDQSAFLPPLLDSTGSDKINGDNPIGNNNYLEEGSHSQLAQPSNDGENENNLSTNQLNKNVNQSRSNVNSRNNLSNKINTRSLSRQNMNSQNNIHNNNKLNLDLEKGDQSEKSSMNTSQNGLSNSSLQMRKASKKSSLNNIVKNMYNSVSGQKQDQPKVLSPTKNKSQNVFKINNIENRSNSVSGIYNNIMNNTSTSNNGNSGNATSNNINNQCNPVANVNPNVNGYYPVLNSRKQSNSNIASSVNNSNTGISNGEQHNVASSQNQQNIMDDSVEEYLEYSQIPAIDPSKTSQKPLGIITAYGANTHQGLVRNYNEDRVSIILNMAKPKDKPEDLQWPNVSFFAIYDGHGGSACAEYLRDNLHYYIIRDENFPSNPKQAILKGFEKIEETYLEKADSGPFLDKSGSCAIVALIIEKTVYVANVGDSRAILSSNFGKNLQDLSEDHKPSLASEEQRITSLGGHIYQSVIPIYGTANGSNIQQIQEVIKGPHRAFPGRLAVSRTLGDAEAKLSKYGGIKGVISAEPEIQVFEIQDNHDFILLGCDGIFDKMTSKETIQCCWSIAETCKTQHEYVGKAIENTMRQSMMKQSYDNVTVVIVGLKNIEYFYQKQNKS